MQRIILTKYGFIRDKEEDFSDDGNRFQCYKVGKRVRVSKLVSDGEVYISARIDGSRLTYEEYSKLPHYRDLDVLNGVSQSTLTEADLVKLFTDCMIYEREYEEAERNAKFPTFEEIRDKYQRVKALRAAELIHISSMISVDKLMSWSKSKLTSFQDYYNSLKRLSSLNPEELAARQLGTAHSKTYVWSNQDEGEHYYYTWLKEFIEGKRSW